LSTQPIYVATAQAYDDEMVEKGALRRQRRTFEEPLALIAQPSAIGNSEHVLVDCATMWLSNLLLKEADASKASD
jgi:adenosylcobinamide kinase/adenosylcobinamide-phosphate guanylyltransferase